MIFKTENVERLLIARLYIYIYIYIALNKLGIEQASMIGEFISTNHSVMSINLRTKWVFYLL